MRNRGLRLADMRGIEVLASLAIDQEDRCLKEMIDVQVELARAAAEKANDPFRENEPLRGELAKPDGGGLPLIATPCQNLIVLPVRDVCRNVLAIGPTGWGKTTFSQQMVFSLIQQGAIVVVFDKKDGEFAEASSFLRLSAPLVISGARGMAIAAFQPPEGTQGEEWGPVLGSAFAASMNLYASERLISKVVEGLYAKERLEGTYPSWSEFVQGLEAVKAPPMSRVGGYREAALFAAETVGRELGEALNFASSDFLAQLQQRPGCMVICVDHLSSQVTTFLVSLVLQYIYRLRSRGFGSNRPIVFLLDDALGLVRGGSAQSSDRGNPIAELALLGRSKGIGFIVCAQSFSAVSPVLRNNCATQIVCGASGGDAAQIGREWGLTFEQVAQLPLLTPGEAVVLARTVWPYPVRGRFPKLP